MLHKFPEESDLFRYVLVTHGQIRSVPLSKDAESLELLFLDLDEFLSILSALTAHLEEVQRVMGDDPFSYGMEENLATLQTFLQYMREQGLVGESLTVEELFAPETHRTVELAKA